MYKTGEISLLFFTEDAGPASFKIEEDRQSLSLALRYFEFIVLEEMLATALDHRYDPRLPILIIALREDRHDDLIVRSIIGVAIGIAFFELWDLEIFAKSGTRTSITH